MKLEARVIRVKVDRDLMLQAKKRAKQEQKYLQRWLGEAIEEKVRRLDNDGNNGTESA